MVKTSIIEKSVQNKKKIRTGGEGPAKKNERELGNSSAFSFSAEQNLAQ